jgi:hypothetical protein
LAATARAQAAPNPIVAPTRATPTPAAPERTRAISPDVAARLAASAPKYTPPPPAPPPKPEEEVDLRDVDKPRNGIIRLPKYIVQERKPAVLDERAVNTEKGLKDIAVRRYISELDHVMNRFSIPLLTPVRTGNGNSATDDRALAMYREDERLRNMADMRDAAVSTAKSDPSQGAYILRESRNTFMRTSDFGWSGGSGDKPTFTEGADIQRLSH